jgi:phosphatidylglycerol:prolipoprotein diacylglycerol transferase
MPTGFSIGPLTIRFYGLLIMIGVLAALALATREALLRKKDPDFIYDAFPWVLIAGVLGARIWHILTPPQSMVDQGVTTRYYLTHLEEAVAVWKGGLGIYGAVLGGGAALLIYAAIKGRSFWVWADILAPGVALAQAVGRWGNFINQEVYGLPTSLPWAIYIDPQHRYPGFEDQAFYHPLFLYESLWSLLNMAVLLWLSRNKRDQLREGSLFLLYVIIYGLGRFGLEFLRLDVSTAGGVNVNQWFVLAAAAAVGGLLVYRQQGWSSRRREEQDTAGSGKGATRH